MSKPAKIDAKGRLKIPVSFLATLKEPSVEFFVTSEDGQCVRVYPAQFWSEIEKRLVRLGSHSRNMQKLLVRAKYFGRTVKMDRQGRVLVPAILRETARVKGQVDVLDYENYWEVWNHFRFAHTLNRSPVTAQDENALKGYPAEF